MPLVTTSTTAAALTGKWSGEVYSSKTGIPYVLDLKASSKTSVVATLQAEDFGHSLTVHGTYISPILTLSVSPGETWSGSVRGARIWLGQYVKSGTRWNFNFVKSKT